MDVKQRIIEAREINARKRILDKDVFNDLIVEALGEYEQGMVKVYECAGDAYHTNATFGIGNGIEINVPAKVFRFAFEYAKEMGWTYQSEPLRESYNYGYRGRFDIEARLVLK